MKEMPTISTYTRMDTIVCNVIMSRYDLGNEIDDLRLISV